MKRSQSLSSVVALALSVFAVLAAPALAFAADGGAAMGGRDWFLVAIVVTSGFALAFAAAFGALGQGKAIAQTAEGIARQPGASGDLFRTLILGLAFIESLVLYVLVVAMILFFANPFSSVYGL